MRKPRTHGVIYLIKFENGKGYIGQTVRPWRQRMSEHKNPNSKCTALKNAFNKYGEKASEVILLETNVPRGLLDEREKALIAKHRTRVPNGYNIQAGGQLAFKDRTTQDALTRARAISAKFKLARIEVNQRAATTRHRRETTAGTRERRIAERGLSRREANQVRLRAWRAAQRHAVARLHITSLHPERDAVAEVEAFYHRGQMEQIAKQAWDDRSDLIAVRKRDSAKAKRWKAIESMTVEKAVAWMKQARCNAVYVARVRTPEKFQEVRARWESEWAEFEAWALTRDPRASLQNEAGGSSEYEGPASSSTDSDHDSNQIALTHSKSRPSATRGGEHTMSEKAKGKRVATGGAGSNAARLPATSPHSPRSAQAEEAMRRSLALQAAYADMFASSSDSDED